MIKLLKNETKRVQKIFHLSDIHIRLFQRHVEYQYIFEKCYDFIRNFRKGNHIIVVTGDIVHNKNDLSPECDTITIDFLRSLASIYPTLIIAGNHDALLNNRHRMDSITSMLYQRTIPNLYYMKQTGIYEYENILFFVDSLLDDETLKSEADIPKDKLKIGLYHGQVSGWKNNYGFTTETGDKTLNDFQGLDYVLLGDIHKHQFMKRENPVVAYAGSMISQNFGESDEDHGVLLWDLESKTQQLYRFENPYRHQDVALFPKQNYYITDGHKYDVGDISALAAKGQVRIVGPDTVETKLVFNQWKEKLPKTTFHFNQKRKALKEKEIDNELDIEQCEKTNAEQYIRQHTTKDNFQTIYDFVMKKWEENDQFYKHGQWDIERIEFSNMFGYGENNKVLFSSKEPCTIGIFGENSCGKSTLIEIINILLFDKITRFSHGASIPKEVVNFKETKAKGMIELRIGNDLYRIEKKFERQTSEKIKTSTKFFHIADGKKKELTGEQRKRTNSLIGEIVGKFDSFIYTNMFLQQRENNFRDMTSAQKKKFLYELFGFQWFEKLEKEKKDDLKVLEIEYKQQEKNIGSHTHEYWEKKVSDSKHSLQNLEQRMDGIQKGKSELQAILKDLYCEMEPPIEKEKEINLWKEYESEFEKAKTNCSEKMQNANATMETWKNHFILQIPEDNEVYLEWSPFCKKKSYSDWNDFFQPFLSRENNATISLNELYKKLSNYPEEPIEIDVLNLFEKSKREEKEKCLEQYVPEKTEVELKKLYCSLSHSMEELDSIDFFEKKKHTYEKEIDKVQDAMDEVQQRCNSLSKVNSFWRTHCFDLYWQQHEMFLSKPEYQKYSPCCEYGSEWNHFYTKLNQCEKDLDYKTEIEQVSIDIKNLYEGYSSYLEPVCSENDYKKKQDWCKENIPCSCTDFLNHTWNEKLQKLQEVEQSINFQKMELDILQENDKLHPYVFNPDCYACNENPFLENKKKNQQKMTKVQKELEKLFVKRKVNLQYFESSNQLKQDIHFKGCFTLDGLEDFFHKKRSCQQKKHQHKEYLKDIENYKNYKDCMERKRTISSLEKKCQHLQKNYEWQCLWKENEMMWKCILFQREHPEMFSLEVFENTKSNHEQFQRLEKELETIKEKRFVLRTEYTQFMNDWKQDVTQWEKIKSIETQQKLFMEIKKWISMLRVEENQLIREEILQEISQMEHIQKNSDIWREHEKVMRLIDKLWSDKNLWELSVQDIRVKCEDAEKMLHDTEKEVYELNMKMQNKRQTHEQKLEQYERNANRQEKITQEEQKLDSMESEYQSVQKKIQQESIHLASIEEAHKQWIDNVEHIEEKKKRIRAEKQILKLLDKDGLPLHMLKEKVKQMEIQMNELISPFLDRKIQFFIDEKNIEFGTVFDKKPICHYFGGMESFILDLSLKLTFSKFSILPRPNFFIIDERISVLDQQRLYNISFLFQFISNLTTNVLLISHIPQVKDFVDKSIEIIKKNEKSYIQYV